MRLRKLEIKDAPYMLEWMHDELVVKCLQVNFSAKTLKDCEKFIICAKNTRNDLHLAIVDNEDEYMGTASLKYIDGNCAEFAIVVRRCAMGKEYSKYGMSEIIQLGFEKLGLESIYWCVNPINHRAVRFYDKNGYRRVEPSLLKIRGEYSLEQIQRYIWYQVGIESQGRKIF